MLTAYNRVSERNGVLKVLEGTNWGHKNETLLLTYTALERSIANYAASVWSTNDSDTIYDSCSSSVRRASD